MLLEPDIDKDVQTWTDIAQSVYWYEMLKSDKINYVGKIRTYHFKIREEAVKLYPNVVETLKTLHTKGIILTIASSRSHTSLAEYVESRGLLSLISYILGADDVNKGKPQ